MTSYVVRLGQRSFKLRVLSSSALVCGLCMLSGCIQMPAKPDDPTLAPVYAPTPVAPPSTSGSLYREGQSLRLFDDRRAARIGDVITVTLDERFNSSKQSDNKISKSTNESVSQPTVLGSLAHQIATTAGVVAGLTSKGEFEGKADTGQSNSLSGTLSVTVTDVLPNGLMVVRGEKWLTLNQGEEFIRLTGLVRAEDIAPDNTVSSRRLANARISYSGTGAAADSSSMGWLARFFISPLFPW